MKNAVEIVSKQFVEECIVEINKAHKAKDYRKVQELKNYLENRGYQIAIGWPGHRGEYFIVTEDEIEMYWDRIFQDAD